MDLEVNSINEARTALVQWDVEVQEFGGTTNEVRSLIKTGVANIVQALGDGNGVAPDLKKAGVESYNLFKFVSEFAITATQFPSIDPLVYSMSFLQAHREEKSDL